MTTNGERREVARRLRDLSSDAEEVSDFDLAKTLGLEAVSRCGYNAEDVIRLADLIEPEPELTCHPVFGECDLCKWPLRDGALYCDHCGARIEVVDDAD